MNRHPFVVFIAPTLALASASCGGGGSGSSSLAPELPSSETSHVTAAAPDPSWLPGAASGSALELPGIADDLTFVAGGQFIEFHDGTACLAAELVRRSAPDERWIADLRFHGRVESDAPAPVGAPALELVDGAYAAQGGPIDPSAWRYYRGIGGRLTGLGALEGARLEIVGEAPLQIGAGANNRNLAAGASAGLGVRVLSQPLGAPGLPDASGGHLNLDLGGDLARCALESDADDRYALLPGGHAIWMPALGGAFPMIAGGNFVERADGTAILTGVVASLADPEKRFSVEVTLTGRVDPGQAAYPPPNSPKRDLAAAAYLEGGGPIDTGTWHYYTGIHGWLNGMRAYRGALLEISRTGPAFQVGQGANGKNLEYGASSWIAIELRRGTDSGEWLPGFQGDADINIDLESDCSECALDPPADPEFSVFESGHALYLPGIGTDFVFEAPGSFRELSDGTARLVGTVAQSSDPSRRFALDFAFSGRVDPWDPDYPPSGSPKHELDHSAYVGDGGPIDSGTWRYYTATEGTLVGLGSLDGALLNVTRFGPSFQVGVGANSLDLEYGASGWLALELVEQPTTGVTLPSYPEHGDVNIDLSSDCDWCATEGDDHAFYLPGIGLDFVFDPPGRFVELADGTARLSGTLENALDPGQRFAVDVLFAGRLLPGEEGYAPAGSPKKELPSSDYVEHGGPIDAGTWRYYTTSDGTLLGLGDLAGAVLSFVRRGPAFQVGFGANGKDRDYGASGWIDLVTLAQPSGATQLPASLVGDVNIDLSRDCE